MTTAYESAASRAAVQAIASVLETLPLNQRADVVEEAYGAALPLAVTDVFKARFSNDPIPVLLVGGEIASDVMHLFEADQL